jgi:hypothetical protein
MKALTKSALVQQLADVRLQRDKLETSKAEMAIFLKHIMDKTPNLTEEEIEIRKSLDIKPLTMKELIDRAVIRAAEYAETEAQAREARKAAWSK